MRRLIVLLAAIGCASQGAPPGGPPDSLAPNLVGVVPDSGAVNMTPDRVEFRFDEVVNERPGGGAPSLEQLVLISPSDGLPRVDWRRRSIAVRPRDDWRENAVYTVTLLPGIADLRGNVMRTGATVVFSTGPTIPDTRLAGTLYDWVAGTLPRNAAIEAISVPDSTVYVARTDTTGQFTLAHLPPGRYAVRGWLDANNNRGLDPREAYDSAGVELRDTATVTLLAFVHDTLPPRINTVEVVDSMTLRVEFNQPLDPTQTVDTTRFRLTRADSSVVPLRTAMTAPAFDRARQDSIAQADTARPPALRAPGAPRRDSIVLPRPQPVARFVVVTALTLQPDSSYRLIAIEARNLMARTGTSARVFTMPPRPAPADTAPADTTPAAPPP
ncbi:MAG: Ig-like domain-containing protein [Gemmatimonadaceae bacterium]